MSFRDECEKADRRYRAGKDPLYIEPERWARARWAQRRIRIAWDRPEWTLDRVYWEFQRRAEQERLRMLGLRPTPTRGGSAPSRFPAGED